MKPKHQRLLFVLVSMVFLCSAVLLTMQAFKQNLVYFYSPTDVAENPPPAAQAVRVGGLVKAGSVKKSPPEITFIIADGAHEVQVNYSGMLPNLFREGQGVIAEGKIVDGKLEAKTILAKHDENYMPREAVEQLKKTGHWKEQYAR